MKISVDKDRKVYTSSSLAGTVNENYYEVLEFTFPEELDNYTKYIEIQAEDLRYVDRIEDNKFTISNALSKYEYLQVQIVCKDLQNNIVYKSNIFTLSTNDSLNIMEDISVEQRDLLDRVELELQEAKEDIEELQETQTEHTEQIQANATEIEALQGRVSTNEADIDNLETEVTNIKTKNAQQDNAINENTQDISDIKAEQTTQNNNIAGNTNRITVLESDSGNKVALSIDSNYVMTLQLLNKANEVLSTGTIDLPIESMIANASYSNGILTLTLQNGQTLNVDISDIVSGLVSETTFNSAVSELQSAITALQGRMTTAETNITTLQTNVATNTQDITEIKTEQTTQNENIQENTDSIEALTTKHNTEVAELQSQIEDLQEENQALADLIPTGDASGSDITLSDSARYKFKKIVPGGKSEQETFTGKNLFGITTIFPIKNRGVTFTKNNDGTITVNGTATETFSQEFTLEHHLLNGSYVLKHNVINGTQSVDSYMSIQDSNNNNILDRVYRGTTSYNITADNITIVSARLYIPNGTTFNNYTVGTQLEEGSTATDYEPYTGGQPAPNPDYECPIQNVTGNVDVKVENANITSGDELYQTMSAFDATKCSETTIDNKEVIRFMSNAYRWQMGFNALNYKFKKNTQYTIRGLFKRSSAGILYMQIKYKDGSVQNTYSNTDDWKELRIVSNADKTIDIIDFSYSSPTYWYLDKSSWFIGEGDTTDYIEHEEQTVTFPLSEGQVLHKDDTIEDKIVQKRTTKVFNGTENWAAFGNNVVLRNWDNKKTPAHDYSVKQGYLCNIALESNEADGNMNNNTFATHNSKTDSWLVFNIITTVADWKAFLAEKYANGTPVTLEYELETPLETEFTEAQRTAKAQIDKLYSYKGTTHITSNANLDVTYRKDPNIRDTRLDALEARVALLEE